MARINTGIIGLFFLFLNACATINAGLKAGPIADTEFAHHALAATEGTATLAAAPVENYPFHRVWRAENDEIIRSGDAATIYVAPVDTTQLAGSYADRWDAPAKKDVEELAVYLRAQVENELRGKSFHVVSERPASGRIIELALVEVSTTDVGRNLIGTVLSVFVPGGGLVAVKSSGSTAIEGVVRDAASGAPLFVFADRERGKTAPFSFNDFTHYSHAREAIDDWAEQLVKICTMPSGARLADSSAVTLLPL